MLKHLLRQSWLVQCTRHQALNRYYSESPKLPIDISPLQSADRTKQSDAAAWVQEEGCDKLDDMTTENTTQELEDIENEDMSSTEPEFQRKSEAFRFGESRIGMVTIPKDLEIAIKSLVKSSNSPLTRDAVDKLLLQIWTTGTGNKHKRWVADLKTGKKELVPHHAPFVLQWLPSECYAFMATRMQNNYAALVSVFSHIKKRIPEFKPDRMLDFGSGPGTAIWAAGQVFEGSITTAMAYDKSADMRKLCKELSYFGLKHAPSRISCFKQLTANKSDPTPLVVSAFVLEEIPLYARTKLYQKLWDHTGDVLVFVERGTKIGSEMIHDAREYYLKHFKDECHIVAPCSHDQACPMKKLTSWCHFSQRLQRDSNMMKWKKCTLNNEDMTYSYIVIRKGKRPELKPDSSLQDQAYHWRRLVAAPIKNKGHIILDSCSPSGNIDRMVVSGAKQYPAGHIRRLMFRDAIKAHWHDLWPHPPTSKLLIRREKVPDPEDDIPEEPVVRVEGYSRKRDANKDMIVNFDNL